MVMPKRLLSKRSLVAALTWKRSVRSVRSGHSPDAVIALNARHYLERTSTRRAIKGDGASSSVH
jgi:hypothetical protein